MLERKAICCVCKKRLSKLEDNKVIWEGHYDTPYGLFCVECHVAFNIERKKAEDRIGKGKRNNRLIDNEEGEK